MSVQNSTEGERRSRAKIRTPKKREKEIGRGEAETTQFPALTKYELRIPNDFYVQVGAV